MKQYIKVFYPSLLVCLFLLVGCSYIDPIGLEDAGGIDNATLFQDPLMMELALQTLQDNSKEFGGGSIAEDRGDFAIVINDASLLKNIEYEAGIIAQWPEIDFKNHTVIVGAYYAMSGYRVSKQQIKKKEDSLELYIEIKGDNASKLISSYHGFGGIYPMLPNLPVKIIRKNNY